MPVNGGFNFHPLCFCWLAGTNQVVLGDLVSTKVDDAKRIVGGITSEQKENNEEALDCDQLDDTAVVDLPGERSDLVKVSIFLVRVSALMHLHSHWYM